MIGNYPLHLMILVLLWGYIYTSWSLMGRMGMVSFGHGAFMGIGAYTVVMLWNHYGVSPWIGAPAALAVAAGGASGSVAARAARGAAGRGGRLRDRHRLSLLPLPNRRPLLCARHARPLGGDAAGFHGDARADRRLARRDAERRAHRGR